jgi:hypothetical protein
MAFSRRFLGVVRHFLAVKGLFFGVVELMEAVLFTAALCRLAAIYQLHATRISSISH